MDSILELQLPATGVWTRDCTILRLAYSYEVWGYVPIEIADLGANGASLAVDMA